jgi:hypothetical protein
MKLRSLLVRSAAVLAVMGAYAVSGVGTQILSTVGLSSFVMAASSTPADARSRRRRRVIVRRRRRRRY